MNGVLKIEPCISTTLNEYNIRYEYFSSTYNIKVINRSHDGLNTVKSFKVNGEELLEKQVKLIDNSRIYELEVVI